MQVEHVERWIGCEVLDQGGELVGKLTEVYFRGSEPVLISAKDGRLTRKRRLVPLDGAVASRDYLRVAFAADRLVETKSGDDDLTANDLAVVAEHYGAAHTAAPEELEGSRARAERVRAAAAAEQEARALEAEAEQRALNADDAAQRAVAATAEAERAQREKQDAEARAEQARAVAGEQ
ncbi:hypothetical protein DSM112329_03460 [Paraconexibacter sp. AEG42_29]|uniref:PRC-barrel domain-containing protein n=1 Tax=Paraconexibacter sp. AEG42_29 TaxID=2997339 RepID=A0AAU7AY79_9ACTN